LLLSGRLPFITSLGGDAGAAELVHLHRTAQPISLVEAIQSLKKGECIPDVLRALDPIVMKALAKNLKRDTTV